ncbi:hypothetical protein Glove_274g8 [Diversispora epigaea]|uniref:Uncharacterized protein n=1 Tax=Diversispora epigaea TaxID=1348612 RepID=A0A397IBM6_9GLOM|nr:hypothetical protein Glove_274g8 [Diversispora epigaea]
MKVFGTNNLRKYYVYVGDDLSETEMSEEVEKTLPETEANILTALDNGNDDEFSDDNNEDDNNDDGGYCGFSDDDKMQVITTI